MPSGPSKLAEAIVAALIPPTCREEIAGDLHERFRSPAQYAADALMTVPLVIASRVRRTADPKSLLMQAFVSYLAFLGGMRLDGRAGPGDRWGLVRAAIPAAMVLLGLIMEDAYAHPGRRSSLHLVRGPLLGIAIALASQAILWVAGTGLALPPWNVIYGCAVSLPLSSAIRLLFPPVTAGLLGANAPAVWLKQSGEPREKAFPAALALAIIGVLVLLMVVYRISKQG